MGVWTGQEGAPAPSPRRPRKADRDEVIRWARSLCFRVEFYAMMSAARGADGDAARVSWRRVAEDVQKLRAALHRYDGVA